MEKEGGEEKKVVKRWRPRFEGKGPFSRLNILSIMLGEANYFRLTGRSDIAQRIEEEIEKNFLNKA